MGNSALTSEPQPGPPMCRETKIDRLDQLLWSPRSHPPTRAMVRRMLLTYSAPVGSTAATRLQRRIQYRLWDRLDARPRNKRRK
ncbi:hypothetical protein GCM10010837_24210 [Aminobacter niigataensis]